MEKDTKILNIRTQYLILSIHFKFLLIDFREREKHQFVVPLIYTFIGCFLCVA